MGRPFRSSAGFGKHMEYWVAGLMIKEGLDVYMSLVDDKGIDMVVRREDGMFVEVQVKARSEKVVIGDTALFAGIVHEERDNYYFVFYSERLDKFWIMTSEEFVKESVRNKMGRNKGKRSIWFNGKRRNKATGKYEEHCVEKIKKSAENESLKEDEYLGYLLDFWKRRKLKP